MVATAPDDNALIAAWRGGDKQAGNTLVARHFDSICRFFRTKVGDDVGDLIQRTFLDCVQNLERIELGGFRAYLFGIARHRLLRHLRDKYRDAARFDAEVTSVANLGTTPSQRMSRDHRQLQLHEALRRLPVDHQIALELAYFEDLSAPEIAAVIGVPANTIRSRLARAREGLRDHLAALDAAA